MSPVDLSIPAEPPVVSALFSGTDGVLTVLSSLPVDHLEQAEEVRRTRDMFKWQFSSNIFVFVFLCLEYRSSQDNLTL